MTHLSVFQGEEQGVCQVQRYGKRERLRLGRIWCPKNARRGLHAVEDLRRLRHVKLVTVALHRPTGEAEVVVLLTARPLQTSKGFSRPRPTPRVAVAEASSRCVIRAGVFFVAFHGPVASAHVFHTVVFGRDLAPVRGRHTMEGSS